MLDMPKPGEQNRLTVLFRILLLIPQFIVVWVLSVVAFFVAVIGWFERSSSVGCRCSRRTTSPATCRTRPG
ncbi:hypothetical protein ACFQ0M_04260 [Kitasatospora aburaviensis]